MPTSYTLGFVPLPPRYWLFLAFMLLGYATLTQVVKTMVHSQVWRMMVVAAERIASAARSRARSFAAGADHSGSLLPREGLCPRATKHAFPWLRIPGVGPVVTCPPSHALARDAGSRDPGSEWL